jgi:hypothetical protein
MYQFAI